MFKNITIYILFSFLFVFSAISQNHNLRVRNIRFDNDNIPVEVLAIYKDSKGFIWFAANRTLYKYDGYSLTQYLHNYYPKTIKEDTLGNLWIGLFGNGLCRFNPRTEQDTVFHFNTSPQNGQSNIIINLAVDNNNNIWCATCNGLFQYIQEKDTVIGFMHKQDLTNSISSSNVRCLCFKDENELWIGTDSGLDVFDIKSGLFRHFYHDVNNPKTISSNNTQNILLDSKGIIWITTRGYGLNRYNKSDGTFTRFQHNPDNPLSINSNHTDNVVEDGKGNLWVTTWQAGVNVFNRSNETFTQYITESNNPESIIENTILSIFVDNSDIVWLGYQTKGIDIIDQNQFPFFHYTHIPEDTTSLSHNIVTRIIKDSNDNIWIGTEIGLNKWEREKNCFIPFLPEQNKNSLHHQFVYSLFEDSPGVLYIGNIHGLNFFDSNTGKFVQYSAPKDKNFHFQNVQHVFKTTDNQIWVTFFPYGYSLFNREDKTFAPLQDSLLILCHYQDKAGNLWFGSNNGLHKWGKIPKKAIYQPILSHEKDTLLTGDIYCISADDENDNLLWLCTAKGLLKINKETKEIVQLIDASSGLPDASVMCMLKDENNNFWIGTEKGLSKYNEQNKSMKNYSIADGLNNIILSHALKPGNSEFIFGGENGITLFNPNKIIAKSYIPPIALTEFKLFNKPVALSHNNQNGEAPKLKKHISYTDSIVLSYKDEVFSFEFAALDYAMPQQNMYAYKMEGFDKDWVQAKNKRDISYTNLDPGKYTLKVKGTNSQGIWNENGAKVAITIKPPWYWNWWSKLLWTVLSIGSLITIYLIRVTALQRQKHKLEQVVRERTEEILQQKEEILSQAEELKMSNDQLVELTNFRQNMTHMIAHDLKNPLSSIINFPEEDKGKNLKQVKQAARQMLNMILNMIDVHKFEETKIVLHSGNCSLYEIVESAMLQVLFLAEQKSIFIESKISQDIGVFVDKEIIDRVMVNLLTNAIKYTPLNGNIKITSSLEDKKGFVKIEVVDTGAGIPDDEIPYIFEKFYQHQNKSSGNVRASGLGLTFCKMAVEGSGGEIDVKSVLGNGTTFMFTLPLGEKIQQQSVLEKTSLNDNLIELSEYEQNVIKPYLYDLKNIEVYKISRIKHVLDKINTHNNTSIEKWKQEIQNCLYSTNEKKYNELINMIN